MSIVPYPASYFPKFDYFLVIISVSAIFVVVVVVVIR